MEEAKWNMDLKNKFNWGVATFTNNNENVPTLLTLH